MVEKVEINQGETTSEKPEEVAQTDRPQWLPEKFETPEDMVKSYGELETKLGEPKLKEEVKEEPKKESDLSIDKAEQAVESAGLDMTNLQQQYNENGQLDESSYESLQKAGIPKDYVDAFIKGQEAIAQQTSNSIKQEVGGEESYKGMTEWASNNLTEAEQTAYNKSVNGGDIEQTRLAVQGLNARYKSAEGVEPNLQSGQRPSLSNAQGYRSWAEVTTAMNDTRYSNDSAYRNDVQAKLKVSNI
jgi:hypothetical protein